jgi:hypothetical protein
MCPKIISEEDHMFVPKNTNRHSRKSKNLYATTILAIMTLIFCCESNPIKPDAPEYFPNSEGLRWIYEEYDSTTELYDTLTVEIIKPVQMADSSIAMQWQYSYNIRQSTYSDYYRTTDTIIYFYSDSNENEPIIYLKIPITIDQKWENRGTSTYDSSWIIGIDEIIFDNDTLDCYEIMNTSLSYGYSSFSNIWFVPYMGIAKSYWSGGFVIPDPFPKKVWTLIEYNEN